MPKQRLEEEYKGFLVVVQRIGSFGEYTAFAIRPRTNTRVIDAGSYSGHGAKKAAYNEIISMIDQYLEKL